MFYCLGETWSYSWRISSYPVSWGQIMLQTLSVQILVCFVLHLWFKFLLKKNEVLWSDCHFEGSTESFAMTIELFGRKIKILFDRTFSSYLHFCKAWYAIMCLGFGLNFFSMFQLWHLFGLILVNFTLADIMRPVISTVRGFHTVRTLLFWNNNTEGCNS